MAAQECKNIWLVAALKDFCSSTNRKLKKIKFVEILLQDNNEENIRIRCSKELLLS